MNLQIIEKNNTRIAHITSDEILIHDAGSALDLFMTIFYNHDCSKLIIKKSLLSESFFDLKTGIAGDVVQKVVNYQMHLAVFGDFSVYSSLSLKDFIYECNQGKDILFLESLDEAIEKLCNTNQ